MMNKTFGIYVHIPFCEKKCVYCAFSSFVARNDIQKKYFESLIKEISSCQEKGKVKTIYFGGGTPSCVPVKDIKKVLFEIKKKFEVDKNVEITIECNPNSTDLDKLKEYKKMGFNRISFGVQSLDDEKLRSLGRLHTKQQAYDAVKNAKLCGFENISVDFLIGIPDQTKKDILDNVAFVKKMKYVMFQHICSKLRKEQNYLTMLKKGKQKFWEMMNVWIFMSFLLESLRRLG